MVVLKFVANFYKFVANLAEFVANFKTTTFRFCWYLTKGQTPCEVLCVTKFVEVPKVGREITLLNPLQKRLLPSLSIEVVRTIAIGRYLHHIYVTKAAMWVHLADSWSDRLNEAAMLGSKSVAVNLVVPPAILTPSVVHLSTPFALWAKNSLPSTHKPLPRRLSRGCKHGR